MTSRPCGLCEKPQMFGSTATNPICLDCGVKYELCIQCGADVKLRPRRKFQL